MMHLLMLCHCKVVKVATKYLVNLDLVELLQNGGYSWQCIADVFSVSRTTLWRQIKETGMPINNYTDISDSDFISVRYTNAFSQYGAQVVNMGKCPTC